ncbi:hypothetical protein HDU93_007981, partial [Gonapodya sp. JEL0774]
FFSVLPRLSKYIRVAWSESPLPGCPDTSVGVTCELVAWDAPDRSALSYIMSKGPMVRILKEFGREESSGSDILSRNQTWTAVSLVMPLRVREISGCLDFNRLVMDSIRSSLENWAQSRMTTNTNVRATCPVFNPVIARVKFSIIGEEEESPFNPLRYTTALTTLQLLIALVNACHTWHFTLGENAIHFFDALPASVVMESVKSVAAYLSAVGSNFDFQKESAKYEHVTGKLLNRFPNVSRLEGDMFCPYKHGNGPTSVSGWIPEERRVAIRSLFDAVSPPNTPIYPVRIFRAPDVFPNLFELGTLVLENPCEDGYPKVPSLPYVLPNISVLHVQYYTREVFQPSRQSKVVEDTQQLLQHLPALVRVVVKVALFLNGWDASLGVGTFLSSLITVAAVRVEIQVVDAQCRPFDDPLADKQWKFKVTVLQRLNSWPKVLKAWDGTGIAVVVGGKARFLR